DRLQRLARRQGIDRHRGLRRATRGHAGGFLHRRGDRDRRRHDVGQAPPSFSSYLATTIMKKIFPLIAAVALAAPIAARAIEPNDYVHTPGVEYGEREIDFKYGTDKFKDDGGRESMGSIGFGYGATQWWFVEAYLKYAQGPGDRTRYDAW